MRLRRIALLALAALFILAGFGAAIILWNQDRIIATVIAAVNRRIGVEVSSRSATLRLGRRLVVVLDQPRLTAGGREVMKLDSLRVVLGWRTVILNRGLPLRALVFERPDLIVASEEFVTTETAWRHPGERTLEELLKQLDLLSAATHRIEVVDATVRDDAGELVCDDLDAVAYKMPGGQNRWRAGFNASVARAPAVGLKLSGDLSLGRSGTDAQDQIATGNLWFWDAPVDLLESPRIRPSGRLQGSVEMNVTTDGTARGEVQFDVRGLKIRGDAVTGTLDLGDFSLRASFDASARRYALTNLILADPDRRVIGGQLTIDEPYSADPNLSIRVSGFKLNVAKAKQRLDAAKDVPREWKDALAAVTSGNITIDSASLATPLLTLRAANPGLLRRELTLSATINNVSAEPPKDTQLPAVQHLSARVAYGRGVFRVTQGSARIGSSTVERLSARANFGDAQGDFGYELALRGDANLEELFPAIEHTLANLELPQAAQLRSLSGRMRFDAQASGQVRAGRTDRPERYTVSLEPDKARIVLKDAPSYLEFTSGSVVLDPDVVRVDKLVGTASKGTARLDGDLSLASRAPAKGITVELDTVPTEDWLPLALGSQALKASGPVSGTVLVRNDARGAGRYVAQGQLVLSDGSVLLGFLRSPIFTHDATLKLAERSIDLHLPMSTLEGSAIDFRLAVADLDDPVMEITAFVDRLDFETMKFVKMPWSPRGEPTFFDQPAKGHVEVKNGNLGALKMSEIKTDFTHLDGDWRVYNYTATSYRGRMNLELSGRKQDYWLHMKGTVKGMEAGPLFLLSATRTEAPMVGTMDVAADLWADTGVKFYDTLTGKMSLTVRDGRLNRFVLLSRLLGLIDLKSWLTANFPDPRVAGLPFEVMLADLNGEGGVFWTENFLVHGPVMDIAAKGSVDLGRDTLDMEVGMYPFRTVNWLIDKVPVIGANVAGGTDHLVAGYFQVRGPYMNPSVTPKPITSVAEFVKKTLGIPINIIRPQTIK
jgi:hypothetical protein